MDLRLTGPGIRVQAMYCSRSGKLRRSEQYLIQPPPEKINQSLVNTRFALIQGKVSNMMSTEKLQSYVVISDMDTFT
jgi:hypothetical protein